MKIGSWNARGSGHEIKSKIVEDGISLLTFRTFSYKKVNIWSSSVVDHLV
ncbi:hypothetical protein KFK09_019968 [Dendrobium nobile]|uniref:Uncharacterized protein n=1 Tax=Dendrobium nobile TaxID=94219 RepID=A0A8T3ASI0_DENNO|nr:hypothetical protein KFK09_019968 [Dendrobium nobile]